MKLDNIKSVYFIGIGGIGMSALARYFLSKGIPTGGYDRVPTMLTAELEQEHAWVHYNDDAAEIPEVFKQPEGTLVVYTPAVPAQHAELSFFRENGFTVYKRSQLLGILTETHKGLCVAGTHGKTTTSTMAAHLLHDSHVGCNAFLGGIAKNYGTNYLLSETSDFVVIEADEFDRSFHYLRPYATVISAADPDHLDIYGTAQAYVESFNHYSSLIQPGGALIMHTDLPVQPRLQAGVRNYSYSRTAGDFHAENIRVGQGRIVFDFVSPFGNIADVELGVPVSINIDNGIAAMALAQLAGVEPEEIKRGMLSFEGVERRFDFKINTPDIVLVSDYAHHPDELRPSILSVREVFTGRKITGVFQPHLFTRTRDFYKEFADSLSLLDEVILLDIYPAREQPIEGVTSRLIFDNLRPGIKKTLCRKEELISIITKSDIDVLMVLGAGDVDNYMPQLEALLRNRL